MSITKHGVTFEDAYTEAAAVAYAGRVMLDCFSLEHPDMPDVLYFVNDLQPFVGTIPGVSNPVTFEACPVRIGRPEESDQASTPEIKLEVDNVSGQISDALDLIRGSVEPWILTNYLFASDDATAPAVMPPTVMEVTDVSYDETSGSLSGSFGDAGNFAIPRLTFKRDAYPALSRQS